MKQDKLIADTIVDVISEERLIPSDTGKYPYKRGFFVDRGFSVSRSKFRDHRMLITEEYIIEKIKSGSRTVKLPPDSIITPSARLLIEEGRILTKLHKIRERSPSVSAKKKRSILKKTGKLLCEACGFDFEEKYGEIGKGFSECHHTKPVSELRRGEKTKLADLSILCANCHQIIHRTKPMISVNDLKSIVLR